MSNQQYKKGHLQNGYDYDLQCWVKDGLVVRCGHPETMKCTCKGRTYEGSKITQVRSELGL